VPEFQPLVDSARAQPGCRVHDIDDAYWVVESPGPMEFGRKSLGLKPAVWYGLFTGGLQGRITVFDRDIVRIEP